MKPGMIGYFPEGAYASEGVARLRGELVLAAHPVVPPAAHLDPRLAKIIAAIQADTESAVTAIRGIAQIVSQISAAQDTVASAQCGCGATSIPPLEATSSGP